MKCLVYLFDLLVLTACPHAPCAAHRTKDTILCPLYKNIGEELRHTSICAAQEACKTVYFSDGTTAST